ncbi:MAG: oligosaccharide flippase family protein [Labilithrix sp.]|nr:oligosaccharide flippase family protein [Labilithrix sp.]MCW5812154.1 oligosaccharide flippase family protein [Labilithrix sp.]
MTEARHEGATALRNGVKLATSLVLTWGVALVITFKLPRYLGEIPLGYYKFGLDYATTLAVFLGFGIDTYISREVAVRPKHASDFFGGVVLVRALAVLPLVLFGWAHLSLTHTVPGKQLSAALFGVTVMFVVLNQTFQQTLQAASQVGGLAVANVVAKILWGGGTLGAILAGAPFWTLPLPMLASEMLKAAFLGYATRKAVDLRFRVDVAATRKVLRVAFPFFIANAAVSLGATLDTVVLNGLVPEDSKELGWYSAASMIARLSALMSPVLSGVLVPMMSRAKHRSEEELFAILRRGLEGVMVIAIPLTLMLALGADFIIVLPKASFLPGARSLAWLAPTFVLAYANVLLWIALMILDRSWTITVISFIGLALLPIFIFAIHPFAKSLGGDGAIGMGVAMALSARELVVAIIFFVCIGKRAVDDRSVRSITKSLGICCAVIALHVSLARFGHARLLADMALYAILMLITGVLRPRDVKDILRLIKNRKQLQAEAKG